MRRNKGTNHEGLCSKTRLVSLILCIVMTLGMLPVGVFAASNGLTISNGVLTGVTWYDYNCPTEITIPEGVTTIGNAAFSGRSSKLKTINLPSTLTTIDERGFGDCYALESLELPSSVTTIGGSAFYDCRALTNISIPESVTSLGEQAFYLCESLTTVELPSSLTSFGSNYTFGYCGFSEIELPNNIHEIPTGTFYYCDKLETIELPEAVTTIGDNAFLLCSSLKSITIHNNVETIKEDAFDRCTALVDVYYAGSEEEWTAIDVATGNDALLNATIHYNYGAEKNEIPADAAEFNGHYYKVYSIETSAKGAEAWEEAKAHCEELGGYLAVISSQEENDFLLDYIMSVGETNAYFGFTDEAKTGTWKWVDAPETSNYTNWAYNEPSGSTEHYAMFYYGGSYFVNGEWNNGNFGNGTVDDDKNYICEWISDDASICPTVTNLQSNYTITEGDKLSLDFTVKAGGEGGLLNVVTIREPDADKQYYRQTDVNATSLSVNTTISDLSAGTHTLYVYATANNFTSDPVTGNNVIATIEVTVEPLVAGIPDDAQLYNGNSYYLYDKSMTWEEAKAYCEKMGGHLVTITDANEQAFLTSMVDSATLNCYWIGATDTSGSWKWVTNEDFSFKNWKENEPNNEAGKEDCAVIIAKAAGASQYGFVVEVGDWNDITGDGYNGKKDNDFYSPSSLGFVCEWEATSVQPTVTGLQSSYTLTEGQELSLNFTVKAGGTGLLNVVTIREPAADKQHYRQADISKAEHTVSTKLSGLAVGQHNLVVYATATNFNGDPTNEIFEFTVTVNAKQEEPDYTLEGRVIHLIICNEKNKDFTYGDYQYDYVSKNDAGAASVGLFQWREERAFNILNGIVTTTDLISQAEVKRILGTGKLYEDIVNGPASVWKGRTLTDEEAQKVQELLMTPAGINQQKYQANQDAKMYCNNAAKNGITQEAAKLVFADANNLALGPAKAIAQSAIAKVGGDGSKVTWELLLEEYAAHATLGKDMYKQRRDRIERLLTEWYGSSSATPPVVEPIVPVSPVESMICALDNTSPVSGETVNLRVIAKAKENFAKFAVQWYNPKGDGQSPKVPTDSISVSGKEIDITVPVNTEMFGTGKYHIYLVTESGHCEFREVELYVNTSPSIEPPTEETNYKVYINGVETAGAYKNSSNQLLKVTVDGISSMASYAALQLIDTSNSQEVVTIDGMLVNGKFHFYIYPDNLSEGKYSILMYSGASTIIDSAKLMSEFEIAHYKVDKSTFQLSYDYCTNPGEDALNDEVNRIINRHLEDEAIVSSLEKGEAVVFFIEGAGTQLQINTRMASLCVVLQKINGKISVVWVDRYSTTIPDHPLSPITNSKSDNVPICRDGTYRIKTWNHSGEYAALKIMCYEKNESVIRVYGGSVPEKYVYTTSSALNIHARSQNYLFSSSKPYANSAGCFNVGKNDTDKNGQTTAYNSYNAFMKIFTGMNNARGNLLNEASKVVGYVVIDRSLYEKELLSIYAGHKDATAIVDGILRK